MKPESNGQRCTGSCAEVHEHPPACRLVVITGGPGAGKTALLETVRRDFCEHVALLPEAASIVFGGGFPRHQSEPGRRASQRAIYHVQDELERMVQEERRAVVALCDRGTVDGLAYWPGDPSSYWGELGTTKAKELAKYSAVIHLRTPRPENYNHQNPLRIESAREAAAIDQRIAEAWSGHPHFHVVDRTLDFLDKIARAVAAIRTEVPACCQTRTVAPDSA